MGKAKSKIALYIIITILMSAIVAGGGVYLGRKNVSDEEESALEKKIDELEQKVVDLQESNADDKDSENEIVNNNGNTVDNNSSTDSSLDWKIYMSKNNGMEFSIKYPDSWTYQKFSCNIDGIAFCPLASNSPSNCKMTCSANDSSAPIYLYPLKGTPVVSESGSRKYWREPNVSLNLSNDSYKGIYQDMISSFDYSK